MAILAVWLIWPNVVVSAVIQGFGTARKWTVTVTRTAGPIWPTAAALEVIRVYMNARRRLTVMETREELPIGPTAAALAVIPE